MKFLKLFALLLAILSVPVYAAQTVETAKLEKREAQVKNDLVDINSADLAALQSLKGIGAQKAQAIISYREEHGYFKSIDDLSKVKGFNEKLVAKLIKQNPDRMMAKTKA